MGKKSDQISAFGKEFECFKALVEAVQDEGGSDVDLNRLLDKDHARTVARALLGTSDASTEVVASASMAVATDPHLRVMVDGSPLPSLADLNTKYFDWAPILFDDRKWTYHKSCQNLQPGERDFLVKYFGNAVTSDEVFAWAEVSSYRPATHLEAISFSGAHPGLQRNIWIVALGSSAMLDGYSCVAVLCGTSSGRALSAGLLGSSWGPVNRFLLVRK